MQKTKEQKTGPYPLKGTIHANIQIPEALHRAMKAIRQARHEIEGADVKLCRLYREAVEAYVSAARQQKLLALATAPARVAPQKRSRRPRTLRAAV